MYFYWMTSLEQKVWCLAQQLLSFLFSSSSAFLFLPPAALLVIGKKCCKNDEKHVDSLWVVRELLCNKFEASFFVWKILCKKVLSWKSLQCNKMTLLKKGKHLMHTLIFMGMMFFTIFDRRLLLDAPYRIVLLVWCMQQTSFFCCAIYDGSNFYHLTIKLRLACQTATHSGRFESQLLHRIHEIIHNKTENTKGTSQGPVRGYRVLHGSSWFYMVLHSSRWFYMVPQGSTGWF